jgi:uncharacterized protein (TIGR02270 family)
VAVTLSPVISAIVEQHAEELATLWTTRERARLAADVTLRQLARLDERISAHQDGCVVAGDEAVRVLNAQLESVSPGHVFAAAVVGLDSHHDETISRCLSLAETIPAARRGLNSALGWVSADRLRGVVKDMLTSPSEIVRAAGLAACRLHGVNAGAPLVAGLKDESAHVRGEAFRAAGVLGQADLASTLAAVVDTEPVCQFWSAWSAVLLGDRGRGLNRLTEFAIAPGDNRRRAFILACQTLSTASAHQLLSDLSDDPIEKRWLIEGTGLAGDPRYVPWLLTLMADDNNARLAGESFSLITGADLVLLELEREQPADFVGGPTDDPEESAVMVDTDEGLPWPAQAKAHAWWKANNGAFRTGVRYFMGRPLVQERCLELLKTGGQRQRMLAAQYQCLLQPGTAVFNTSAPAWRQQRLLARL